MPQLTVDLNELGLPVTDAGGWVQAVDSLGKPYPVLATTTGAMVFGSRALDFSTAGVATISLPSTDSLVPAGARYLVFLTRADFTTQPVAVGPFIFEADAHLGAVAVLPPADVAETLNEAIASANDLVEALGPLNGLASRLDGHVDHGSVSGALDFNGPVVAHWFDAVGSTTITLKGYEEGQVVSLLAFAGAEEVTVVGMPDLKLVDGLVASAMLARGVWVTGGGGGTPATPDTTPPTAVTDLVATGGVGQIALAWSAATDEETTVQYRYRAWLTASGPSGTWRSTSSTSATISGLAAGAYTAEVYSYSNGGSTVPDMADAAVTAPVTWDIGDDFNAANTASINGRSTPVGSKAWVTPWAAGLGAGSIGISSNRFSGNGAAAHVIPSSQNYRVSCDYDVTAAGAQVRVFARASTTNAEADGTASVVAVIRNNGDLQIDKGNDYSLGTRGTGQPTTGNIALEVSGNTGRVFINGTEVGASFSVAGVIGTAAGIGLYDNGRGDNFQMDYL